MIKQMLIAFDLDGTLHSQDIVEDSDALRELAIYLNSREAFTVIATGRSLIKTLELREIMQNLTIDAIVANCGAEVFIKRQGTFILDDTYSFRPDAIIPTTERSALSRIFLGKSSIQLQEDRHQFPSKLSFYVRSEAIELLRSLIKIAREIYPYFEYLISYNPVNCDYHYFDVQSPHSTKLSGLTHLARAKGIAEKDIFYFGDNGNDVPCFRVFERVVIVNTYIDSLREDTKDIDWDRIVELKRGGAGAIFEVLKKLNL